MAIVCWLYSKSFFGVHSSIYADRSMWAETTARNEILRSLNDRLNVFKSPRLGRSVLMQIKYRYT